MTLPERPTVTEHRLSDERFRTVVEHAPSGMILVSAEGRIVLANEQVVKMFGYRREELLGQAVEMLVPSRFRELHPDHRNAFLASPRARPMGAGRELFGLHLDGREVPVEIGLVPMEIDGSPYVLASIIDISERKRAEDALRESLHEKEILLQEVHHRVKNNLQVICSLLDLQARQLGRENQAVIDLFRESQVRVRSMALVHEQLYRSAHFGEIDFAAYLRDLTNYLFRTYRVEGERARLELELAPVRLQIDQAVPCGLAVNELVTNALKYAFPAPRKGTIRLGLREEEGQVSIAVGDDGVGMPSAVDLKGAKTFGLRLVTAFVEQLEGKAMIERTGGTTVRFLFPAARGAKGAAQKLQGKEGM